jgi:hypothetical protein
VWVWGCRTGLRTAGESAAGRVGGSDHRELEQNSAKGAGPELDVGQYSYSQGSRLVGGGCEDEPLHLALLQNCFEPPLLWLGACSGGRRAMPWGGGGGVGLQINTSSSIPACVGSLCSKCPDVPAPSSGRKVSKAIHNR